MYLYISSEMHMEHNLGSGTTIGKFIGNMFQPLRYSTINGLQNAFYKCASLHVANVQYIFNVVHGQPSLTRAASQRIGILPGFCFHV